MVSTGILGFNVRAFSASFLENCQYFITGEAGLNLNLLSLHINVHLADL